MSGGWFSSLGRALDRVGFGVLGEQIPAGLVDEVLQACGSVEQRFRALPSRLGVYVVLGMCLFSDYSYGQTIREMVSGCAGQLRALGWRAPSATAVTKLRRRLGPGPFAMLFARVCVAGSARAAAAPGSHAFGLLLAAWDGTMMDAADTGANADRFARPGGRCGYPQARLLALMTCGTRQLIDATIGERGQGERTLARRLLNSFAPGMLVLADRGFAGYTLWTQAAATGADLLWRVKSDLHLPVVTVLSDGSYLARLRDPADTRRWRKNTRKNRRNGHRPPAPRTIDGATVRVIESIITVTTADGATRTEPYRLITTLLDPGQAPAAQIAAVYARRWAAETGFRELKTSLRGSGRTLRAADPAGTHQELWAYLIVYQLLRTLISRTAQDGGLDPGRISFTAAVCTTRRNITAEPDPATLHETYADLQEQLITTHTSERVCPRALRKPASPYPKWTPQAKQTQHVTYQVTISPATSNLPPP